MNNPKQIKNKIRTSLDDSGGFKINLIVMQLMLCKLGLINGDHNKDKVKESELYKMCTHYKISKQELNQALQDLQNHTIINTVFNTKTKIMSYQLS